MKIIIYLLLFFFTLPLYAQHQELIIKGDTKVYKKRSQSDLLTTLETGTRVPVSTRDYGNWVKVKVQVKGKRYYGWIPKKSIQGYKTRSVDKELVTGKRAAYHRKNGFGLFTNFTMADVSDQEFGDAQGRKVEITGASGTSLFFGFHYDHSLSETKQLHTYLSLREHDVSGDAIFNGGPNEIEVDLTQSFLAIGASVKNYKDRDANFWWAYGLEVAKTNDMEVTLINTTTEVPEEEHDFFIFPHLAFGYDYDFLGNVYLIPEAKLNLAANAGGLSYAIDFKVAISYAF